MTGNDNNYDNTETSRGAGANARESGASADQCTSPDKVPDRENDVGIGTVLVGVDGVREIVPQGPESQTSAADSEVCGAVGGSCTCGTDYRECSKPENREGRTDDTRPGAIQTVQPEEHQHHEDRWSWKRIGFLDRWWRNVDWKIRRIRVALELQPDRVQRLINFNRKANKLGALIYGPMSFTAGIMVATGHSLWWLLLPGVWFIGMLFSHLWFGRCVLNVIVSKMRKFKKESTDKADLYMRYGSHGHSRLGRRTTKAVSDEIFDTMPSPDLNEKEKL
jgi:hypothetical protein